jgi:hypothetical protein
MSDTHTHSSSSKSHPPGRDCCVDSGCPTGLRNNYYVGKRLTPDALSVEQTYLNERRHLLNRAMYGWGVVYGYGVAVSAGRITIKPGLALDAAGRELVASDPAERALEDLIGVEQGKPLPTGGTLPFSKPGCWLLKVHYAEQRVGQVRVQDTCGCERTQWDRVCETVRFSLQWIDCAKCCEEPKCALACECGTGPCCDEHHAHGKDPHRPVARGGCQCLCDYLTDRLEVGVDCQDLTEVDEPCGRVFVDLRNGVALACLRVTRDGCDPWKFDDRVDACGPRRLVKRNDVLFDLIRGCDLTRIVGTGWSKFHRHQDPVPWHDFAHSWGTHHHGPSQPTHYWIEFSRPVRASTVQADCFAITIVAAEEEGGWGEVLRVPITGVDTTPAPNGPPNHVVRATILVDADWVRDAIHSHKNRFNYQEALVEIEVRGDYIIDCNGQAVDADAVGLAAVPTGNGTPGGRYLSAFRVAPRK